MVPERPLHVRPAALVQVAAGGFCGAAAREMVEQTWRTPAGSLPASTLLINLSGAFLLGVLIEALGRAGRDRGRLRSARLVLGTGFLGAFTTYSTFAVETDLLVRSAHGAVAVVYAAVTVGGALVMAATGMATAAWHHGRTAVTLPTDPDLDGEDR